MKKSVGLASGSIRAAGVPQDPVQVLVEYIWNGFEAGATNVSVGFNKNAFDKIDSIIIRDNGHGIDYQDLDNTFSVFLESAKTGTSKRLKPKKNRGKGRYSFLGIAHNAVWVSTYKEADAFKTFSLTLDSSSSNEYEISESQIADSEQTGTTVTISNFSRNVDGELNIDNVVPILLNRFAWFLYLNRSRGVKISINGVELDYSEYIDEDLVSVTNVEIDNINFEITVIVWKSKIDGSFKEYYMNSGIEEQDSRPTGRNYNTVEFNHSVYVVSEYFDDYNRLPAGSEQTDANLIGYKVNQAQTMREIHKESCKLLDEVYEQYILNYVDTAITKMKNRRSFPKFSNDIYGKMRENDLISITKAIYCAAPDVFVNLKPVQEKSLIGFLSLALNGDERDDVLEIVNSVTSLTPEQRHHFAEILKKTSLANIIEMIEYIDRRYEVIEILKRIITDLARFANERDNIQKIIEENYWIFGEQYNLVSADVQMQKALENYLSELGEKIAELDNLPDDDKKKRMDVFLCGSRIQDYSVEENLIIELKAPKVRLTSDVVNQIAKYAHIIRKEKQFNSTDRFWKFIAVCSEIDSDVQAECSDPVEKHLVRKIANNFKLYAMTWDDVFTNFRIRHDHLLNKLKLRQEVIAKSIEEKIGSMKQEEAVETLTANALKD